MSDSELWVPKFEDAIKDLIRGLGDDPSRQGLIETPARVVRAWKEWCSGYREDPSQFFTEFELDSHYDEMVVFKDVQFYSVCEHHLAPFYGTVSCAYMPSKNKVVGLSKVLRVINAYARRLQVQERMTCQIADCLMEGLHPKAVGVLVRAKHLCMLSRGVRDGGGSEVVTSALRGGMIEEGVKSEFFKLVGYRS
jgi:GTP cyclohydrolase IA